MTVRAVIIGTLLGLVVAAFGYFNDWVIFQAYVAADLVPVSVYGLLILGLLTANPLMRLGRRWRFRAGEWCVAVSLMLAACIVPSPGMMWHLSNTIVSPHRSAQTKAAWKAERLFDYAPKIMFAEPGDDYERVVEGFSKGLGKDGQLISLGEVPWSAWARPLAFWLPLLALSFFAGICLVLVVHRQWAQRERLRYPVAEFAAHLVHGAGGRALPDIFYKGRFWFGFLLAFGIVVINGFGSWKPDAFITIPLNINFSAVGTKWPEINQVPLAGFALTPGFYFAAVGFAYFLNLEVSFSLGISHIVYIAVFMLLLTLGVDMSGSYIAGGPKNFALFGAYVGIALVVFYGGRRFYLAVLRGALCIPGGTPAERDAVWACRGALAAAGAMVLMLVFIVNLDWMLAIMFVMFTGLLFLVMTRISAETGLFFIQPTWHAVSVLLGLFGAAALGPNMLVVLGILSVGTTIDPRVCLMPLVANALRFSEAEGVRPARLSSWMMLAVLLAVAVGVPAALYTQYNWGGSRYSWPDSTADYPFRMLEWNMHKFEPAGGGWQGFRPSLSRMDGRFLWPAAVGLGLALAAGYLRLRLSWWPIHPVLFLVWGTFPMGCLAASFLLGWLIKSVICRLGGGKAFEANKPLFVGLIAGEFLAGIFWMAFGLLYYVAYDKVGPAFRVHP